MNKSIVLGGAVMAFLIGTSFPLAFAQYYGNVGEGGETGQNTLEEVLKLAGDRVEYADANPASGSGTPVFDAGGVVGASAIAGAIFGGIAITLAVRARGGKYVKPGTG
ncbi:MAG: hypothetical protein ACE5JT_04955 [Nitrosopumilaceae archaeon]